MPLPARHILLTLPLIAVLAATGDARADEPAPPTGFRAIFNGKDLSGWHGLNPHTAARAPAEKKADNLAPQRAEFPNHWTIENGELVNNGHGPYANTDRNTVRIRESPAN